MKAKPSRPGLQCTPVTQPGLEHVLLRACFVQSSGAGSAGDFRGEESIIHHLLHIQHSAKFQR